MRRYIHINEVTLAEFIFTATINAPIEKIYLPAWIFGLADDEYQRCHEGMHAVYEVNGPQFAHAILTTKELLSLLPAKQG